MFREKFVAGGALIEIERAAAAQDGNAGHVDINTRGIERYAGASGGGENAAPVGIASGKSGLDERGGCDGFGDAAGVGFRFSAPDFDFDHALGTFAIGDDLKR